MNQLQIKYFKVHKNIADLRLYKLQLKLKKNVLNAGSYAIYIIYHKDKCIWGVDSNGKTASGDKNFILKSLTGVDLNERREQVMSEMLGGKSDPSFLWLRKR